MYLANKLENSIRRPKEPQYNTARSFGILANFGPPVQLHIATFISNKHKT